MRKEKSFKLTNLIRLYLNFLFQKSTIIILSISLLLILVIEIFISNPFLDPSEYLQGYEEIHLTYFTQSFFIVQLFNSIIIATISISYTITSNQFDTMFLSHTSRVRLCASKLIAAVIVLLILCIYEILVINVIPLIRYPFFKLNADFFLSLLYLLLSTITEAAISFLLSTTINIILIPMVFMFISAVIKLLTNNFTLFKNVIIKIIPLVNINYDGINCDGAILAPIWIILITLLYLSVYSIKDLKQ